MSQKTNPTFDALLIAGNMLSKGRNANQILLQMRMILRCCDHGFFADQYWAKSQNDNASPKEAAIEVEHRLIWDLIPVLTYISSERMSCTNEDGSYNSFEDEPWSDA
jgi:hypothetical protein